MAKFLYFFIFITLTVRAQENAARNLSPSLRECYDNKYLLERDNRLPHTLNTFIAILRKIENTKGLNMDLRSLSVALLHRFRQDGIAPNPAIPDQDGISPYSPSGHQFVRFAETLRLIPGNALMFPNNSITDVERCTLHFMLSSSVEIFQRGDEAKVCRFSDKYRYSRDIKNKDKAATETPINDVETLSSDEIKSMTHHKTEGKYITIDPNSRYPEVPPNHPDSARMMDSPRSKCPIENGVVKTLWGTTSLGLVLAGIAAATQPETARLPDLLSADVLRRNDIDLVGRTLENKWLATLAGDLAEVALRQGPKSKDAKFSVGLDGNWNSTALPRWYFLNSNNNYEMTTAEIRGDLDGLILADETYKWYSAIPNLRLSQIFDMYYSPLGFFDSSIRACNRRTMFTAVASNDTLIAQTYSASIVLEDLARATLGYPVIEKFSVQAVNELVKYVPMSMNRDLSCADTDRLYYFNQISVDLTIILDTNWQYSVINPILAYLLESIDINQFNSNFTLINGRDGTPMINSTSSILDFYAYNSSHYENVTHGFDLPKSLKELKAHLTNKLNIERVHGVAGARSDIVLIVPQISDISKTDKDYCLQTIQQMRQNFPDTTILFMALSKDSWSDLVENRTTDLFSISTEDTEDGLRPINDVVSRMKLVPKRLFNSQCGSDYVPYGRVNSYDDYILPIGTNFYKLHPNYFFNQQNTTLVKIQSLDSDSLVICSSRDANAIRETSHAVETSNANIECARISNSIHIIQVSCYHVTFIRDCPPLYISVTSNSTSTPYRCTDQQVCRIPSMIRYTISYENVVCTSGATRLAFNFSVLMIVLVLLNMQ
ncbi:hypothetical protein K0M31_006247 [Melipona bicolor]|uniref:Uncharacterized protein n=2 Tax=Melipona bicolor TaxID=60889 RepID=A0AA40FT78_9HYME|nr:hypothetical protein K0M31_006247 [Melipona bicolor]